MCHCNEIVDVIIRKISNTLNLKAGDEVCAIVNNLGSSSHMESFIVASELSKQLGVFLIFFCNCFTCLFGPYLL